MSHHCHAFGCDRKCPPQWLMCRACWALVPAEIQDEVNRTVAMRGAKPDATWAPWWRAQAMAKAAVREIVEGGWGGRGDWLSSQMALADRLETTETSATREKETTE